MIEVSGTIAERLDGNRVAVKVTARSGGAKVLTRAPRRRPAAVRLGP